MDTAVDRQEAPLNLVLNMSRTLMRDNMENAIDFGRFAKHAVHGLKIGQVAILAPDGVKLPPVPLEILDKVAPEESVGTDDQVFLTVPIRDDTTLLLFEDRWPAA